MALRSVHFAAVILTALALVPGGAHLFALPNKIDLAPDQYFVVQTIYRGWALFGIVLFADLAALVGLAIMLRGKPAAFRLALGSLLCIVATLFVFFVWTYPANVATNNWTVVPANWQDLRAQWEYAHAAGAVITFVALCLVVLSTLVNDRAPMAARAMPGST